MNKVIILSSDHNKVKEYMDLISINRKQPKPKPETIGVFSDSKEGFGFIDTKDESFYVNAKNTKGAKKGDRVKYRVVSVRGNGRKSEAEILEILQTKEEKDAKRKDNDGKPFKKEILSDAVIRETKEIAEEMGANAVISFRMEVIVEDDGLLRIISYGTAVKI